MNIEYESIAERIALLFPSKNLDGRQCITAMKRYEEETGVHTNWRQMEWFGWYSEFLLNTNNDGFSRSKDRFLTYTGSYMCFDYVDDKSGIIFDLKSSVSMNGTLDHMLITNDLTAIKNVIKIRGRLLFVVINAIPSMDMDGSFRIWHDALKGKKSKYAELGESTGRRHRARKKSVELTNIDIFDISDLSIVESMPVMKQGKNSNGNKRPEKMMIDAGILQPEYSYSF